MSFIPEFRSLIAFSDLIIATANISVRILMENSLRPSHRHFFSKQRINSWWVIVQDEGRIIFVQKFVTMYFTIFKSSSSFDCLYWSEIRLWLISLWYPTIYRYCLHPKTKDSDTSIRLGGWIPLVFNWMLGIIRTKLKLSTHDQKFDLHHYEFQPHISREP